MQRQPVPPAPSPAVPKHTFPCPGALHCSGEGWTRPSSPPGTVLQGCWLPAAQHRRSRGDLSAHCGSCVISPLHPMDVRLSSEAAAQPSFSLVPALCAALPLTTFSASLPSRRHMPHSLSYTSFFTTASPSKPSHQLLRHHSSIDRVGQTPQGPFRPPNLVLCFPSKEGGTQAGALSSGVRWSWPHICGPWRVCTDTRKLVFSSPTRRCW